MARRVAFTIPFLVVLAQAVFMHAGFGEPYPALMMPAFSGTRTAPDGSIGVTSIEVAVCFADGAATQIPITTLAHANHVSHERDRVRGVR